MAPRWRRCLECNTLEYLNPQPPEDINVSEKHPLRDFFSLALAVMLLAAALTAVLAITAQWAAPRVPFRVEEQIAAPYVKSRHDGGEAQTYLQELADRLALAQGLPPDISIRVHYEAGPVVNAFATLGGHIVIHAGLIAAMPDENSLAMVIAHEVAHVHHRHPVQAMGRGLAIGVVLSAVSSGIGGSVATRTMGDAGLLTALVFNRAQEEEADATALRSLAGVYGHVGGSGELFRRLRESADMPQPPKLLSTHPLTDERITRIGMLAQGNGWGQDGVRTPLPDFLRTLAGNDSRVKDSK